MVLFEHMDSSPVFQLFGETSLQTLQEGLHLESIADRSKLYDWEISAHRHDRLLQVLHLGSGACDMLLGSELSTLKAPCVVIVAPGTTHGFRFDSDVQGTVLSLTQQKLSELLSFDRRLQPAFEYSHRFDLEDEPLDRATLTGLLLHLHNEFKRSSAWREAQLNAFAESVLICVARLMSRRMSHQSSPNRAQVHMRAFQTLVDEHFRDHLPSSFYAQTLGITGTQLNRVCQKVSQRSAIGIIQDRRMTEACRDLAFSVLSIKQIAFALGFQDESYFTRVFRRKMLRTPLEYRRAMQATMR
jgi:AraC family transcriptional regulator, transcriptional activator of pobA